MSTSRRTSIKPQTRTIDGLMIRCPVPGQGSRLGAYCFIE